MSMTDEALLRYSRQLMLPQLDIAGQERLLASTVLIVGLGGLGSPVALYLAGAGIGRLLLADDDVVDLHNLQRQIIHQQDSVDRPKVESAAAALRALNPDTTIECLPERLQGEALSRAVRQADVVIDATDNFATRFAINRACAEASKPLVSGAAIRFEGQVAVFDHRRADLPCYHCLYEEGGEVDLSCARNGVIAPLVGIIGSIQAMECLKLAAGIGESLAGRLLVLDALTMQFRELRLDKDPACTVCASS